MAILDGADPAAIAAGVGVLAAAAWKIRLWMRQDRRDDRSAVSAHSARDALVDNLREEVERLYLLVDNIGHRLDDEMRLRREVEEENVRLRRRLDVAEGRIAELEGRS